MVLLWAGSGSLALAKEVSLSPDLGGEDTSKLGDFPVPDLKITLFNIISLNAPTVCITNGWLGSHEFMDFRMI